MVSPLSSVSTALLALGARLRRCRLRANLTQKTLAERAGVSLKTVANAEEGRNVSVETLLLLLRALGRLDDIEAVLADDGPSPVELARRQGRRRQRASGGQDDDEERWTW
jgi:putative transcriptional regulator